MAITPLAQRLSGLPLVLAGPMVRRVTTGSATVWVALRFPRKVRLQIRALDGTVQGSDGERETLLVGQFIHIAAVTWHGTLTAGTTYTYDLIFEAHSSGDAGDNLPMGKGLLEPRILAGDAATATGLLTYEHGPSGPSFVVPPTDLNGVRILHGSCRWIASNFPGGPDALPAADGMVAESFASSSFTRPQLMFFTGDQVYADGSEKLFDVVFDAAETLLGWDERMPGLERKLSELSGIRTFYSLAQAGVTNPRKHHLYGIGEYLTWYLMHYSEVLWPDAVELGEQGDLRGTLPAVRRALANIATYMIFDDHEFSDTWYCTAEWCDHVLKQAMGRRILLNALSSYLLCQAWGNDPEQFASGPGADLLTALETRALHADLVAGDLDPIAAGLGIPDAADFAAHRDLSRAHTANTVRWHFTIPLQALDILVLDTYTWRSYPSDFGLCEHLSSAGLAAQIDQVALAGTECLMVVVSNVAVTRGFTHAADGFLASLAVDYTEHWYTPLVLILAVAGIAALLGILLGAITTLLLIAGAVDLVLVFLFLVFGHLLRSKYYDIERGSNFEPHSKSFEQLIARLARKAAHGSQRSGRVVILSGDVHESFTMRVNYWADHPYLLPGEPPLDAVFAQLVSSPLRRFYPKPASATEIQGNWAGWDGTKPSQPRSLENLKLDWMQAPWIARYDPAATGQPPPSRKPDWHYEVELITPDPNQPSQAFPLPPDHPTPTLAELLAEASKYPGPIEMARLENAPVHKMNNLCDVQFDWSASQKKVIHQIWTPTDIGKLLTILGNPTSSWKTTRTEVSMDQPRTPPLMPGEPP